MASPHRDVILALLAELGEIADPQIVENWIRIEYPALDGLSHEQLKVEVENALHCERIREEMAASAGAPLPARLVS